MKVVILAGGQGTRLVEETTLKPKPLIKIGDKPIIWHIMKCYSYYGFVDFIIALGYMGKTIIEQLPPFLSNNENWTINFIDTGEQTQTGGRIKKLSRFISSETFMLTWADGLSDINLSALLEFHRSHGKLATLTAVRPPVRFGHLKLDGERIVQFSEKKRITDEFVNGAFFVLEPGVLDYIEGDETEWELEPLENLARDGELMAYKHVSFWQCMDTLQEKQLLEELWKKSEAPWKVW